METFSAVSRAFPPFPRRVPGASLKRTSSGNAEPVPSGARAAVKGFEECSTAREDRPARLAIPLMGPLETRARDGQFWRLSDCKSRVAAKTAAPTRARQRGGEPASALGRRPGPFVAAALLEELRFAHCAPRRQRLYRRALPGRLFARGRRWALSSAVEHYLDMVGVRGSIPLAPTISKRILASRRAGSPRPRADDDGRGNDGVHERITFERRTDPFSLSLGLRLPRGLAGRGERGPRPGRHQGQARRLGDALRDAARRGL